MLTLTLNATDTIERILASRGVPDGAGVRITPVTQTMNGAGGDELTITMAEEPVDGDEIIEDRGARVFIDDSLAGYLDDMLLDATIVDEQVCFTLASDPDAAG